MYIKIDEKNLGENKFLDPPSQRKRGPETIKTLKMANFRPKTDKT